jgi:hypothetical protein
MSVVRKAEGSRSQGRFLALDVIGHMNDVHVPLQPPAFPRR